MKSAKITKNGFLSKSFFVSCNILSNTYVSNTQIFKFMKISYVPL